MAHLLVVRRQAVRRPRLHVGQNRIRQLHGVVLLFRALRRNAIELQRHVLHLLAGRQRLIQLRRGLVDFLRERHRLVHALAGGQARLRALRNFDGVIDSLNEDLSFVTLNLGRAFDLALVLAFE
ncbi:hypothetical protein BG58_05300 [Caballeronia jiangsuensis]|nr:hypothetical protein BG58_05300 [Caballeronia jiangsuensis]